MIISFSPSRAGRRSKRARRSSGRALEGNERREAKEQESKRAKEQEMPLENRITMKESPGEGESGEIRNRPQPVSQAGP